MGTRPRSAPDVGWMLDVVAREHPARVALVDAETGDRRTYGQLRDRTHQAANALWGLGVRPGQTFGLLAHNCVEYLEVVFAAARIGATVVLVNRRLTVREMVHELHASDVTGLLYSWKYAKAAAEISALTAEKLWWCQTGADVSASEGREVHSYGALLAQSVTTFDHPSEADLADAGLVIIYTSGTTGKPKGAVLTQRNVLAAAGSNQMFYSWYAQRLQPRLRQLVMVGLNHIAGLFAVTMPTLASGGEVVLLDDFDPVKTLRTIDAHRPNFIFGIGSLWDEILAQDSTMYDLSSVELVITCVTYQKSENLRRLRDTFGAELFMTFGQTETTTFTIATRATDDLLERPRTVGKPFGYVEIRLVRQDGTPARAGSGHLWRG